MRTLRLDRLGAYAEAWDELASSTRIASPFLRSWWVDHAAAGEPAVLVCLDDDGTLVGGAAFEIDRIGPSRATIERVRCLGQGSLAPDHIEVLAAANRRGEVLAAIGRWLLDGDRIIDLDGLSDRCELPFLLDADIIERTPAPYVELPAREDPVSRLPGRLRSTIKRSTNRLAREGYEVRRVPDAEADRALDTLLALHDSRWEDDSNFALGWSRFAAAAAAGMAVGEVVIHELARRGEDSGAEPRVIATELEFVVGGRASFYQSGRLTDHEFRGSGSALKAAVLRWAVEEGCTELDLLRGDESYKHDWASGRREVVRVRTGVGPTGWFAARSANLWFRHGPRVLEALRR